MKRILQIISLVVITVTTAKAQRNMTMYNMSHIAQSNYQNPAYWPVARVHFSFLPGISSIHGRIASPVNYSDLANANNLSDLANDLSRVNIVDGQFSQDILSIGARRKRTYVGINLSAKFDNRLDIPKDFVTLLAEGNGKSLLGQSADLGLRADFMSYTEIGLIVAHKPTDKLRLGLRVKYLNGLYNLNTLSNNTTLTTDANTYDLTLDVDAQFRVSSGLVEFDSTLIDGADIADDISANTFLRSGNRGFGVDFGFEYDFNDKMTLSGSLIDVGFIRWRENVQAVDADITYTFDGVSFNEFGEGEGEDFEEVVDSFENALVLGEGGRYRTSLRTRLLTGVRYKILPKIHLAGLVDVELYEGRVRPALGASVNFVPRNWFTVHFNYNIQGGSFTNVGAGLAFNLGPIQYYVASDNMLAALQPKETKLLHLQTGFNWAFGRRYDKKQAKKAMEESGEIPVNASQQDAYEKPKREKKSKNQNEKPAKEVIQSESETIPDGRVLGPDRDKDGVIDADDTCPNTKGLASLNGCPDTDGDQIADHLDACPSQKGTRKTNGCPDSDGDGISDINDLCPNTPGVVARQGCPAPINDDPDNDGVKGKQDICPDEPGTPETRGCPDRDGDRIADKIDECPDLAGKALYNGCPYLDSDKDGIPNDQDDCPRDAGSVENNGCPDNTEEIDIDDQK